MTPRREAYFVRGLVAQAFEPCLGAHFGNYFGTPRPDFASASMLKLAPKLIPVPLARLNPLKDLPHDAGIG